MDAETALEQLENIIEAESISDKGYQECIKQIKILKSHLNHGKVVSKIIPQSVEVEGGCSAMDNRRNAIIQRIGNVIEAMGELNDFIGTDSFGSEGKPSTKLSYTMSKYEKWREIQEQVLELESTALGDTISVDGSQCRVISLSIEQEEYGVLCVDPKSHMENRVIFTEKGTVANLIHSLDKGGRLW